MSEPRIVVVNVLSRAGISRPSDDLTDRIVAAVNAYADCTGKIETVEVALAEAGATEKAAALLAPALVHHLRGRDE
jgi:hypothetical protein